METDEHHGKRVASKKEMSKRTQMNRTRTRRRRTKRAMRQGRPPACATATWFWELLLESDQMADAIMFRYSVRASFAWASCIIAASPAGAGAGAGVRHGS